MFTMDCTVTSIIVFHLLPMTMGLVYVYPGAGFNLSTEVFDDQPAMFGRSIPELGIQGYLRETLPRNACVPLQPLNAASLLDSPWFALVIESASQALCPYTLQARNVQSAGYAAIIVYNKDTDDLKTMRGDGPSIVSVFVTNYAGTELKQYNYKTKTKVLISRNPQLPLQFYLIPFAVVVGICFVFMLIFTVARYIRLRRSLMKNRLSRANLKKIPTKKFKKGDEYDVCAICLDEYEDGDKLRILPCNHVYHCKCVDPWLTSGKKQCPVCKQSVEPASASESNTRNPRAEVEAPQDAPGTSSGAESDLEDNETTPLLSSQRHQPSAGPAV